MKIRPVEEQDIPAVIALWHACDLTRAWNDPEKDLRFAMAGSTSTVLVGRQEGKVIASAMVGHDGHRGALYYLAVSPDCRGKGLGRAIHGAAVSWLRKLGVWKINLMIRSGNAGVKGFYEALGYDTNDVLSLGNRIDQ